MKFSKTLACVSLLMTLLAPQGRAQDALNAGDLDPNFQAGLGADERIFAVDIDTNGNIFIGGSFSGYNESANGNPANNALRFARLHPNGALDRTWNQEVIQRFGTKKGAGDAVNDVLVLPDQKVLLVGKFNSFYGRTYNRIVRLNNDGFIDETFDMEGQSRGFDSEVFALAVQPDGKYLIGGRFTTFKDRNGTHFATNMVRMNPDGTIDPTFVSQGYSARSTRSQCRRMGRFWRAENTPAMTSFRMRPPWGVFPV